MRDDYLTKPFSVLEVVAPVKAIFRRVSAVTNGGADGTAIVRAGETTIAAERRSVVLKGGRSG